jgi:hypothetical protein
MNKLCLNIGCGERTYMFYPHRGYKCINIDMRRLRDVHAICDVVQLPFGADVFDYILASDIIDSSLLIRFDDGKVVLNCNDNKPSPELCRYIMDKYKNIDLALIPGGGGSGYPGMYENYSFEEKIKISQNIVDKYADVFTEAVDILKPKTVVPVAGGFAIRGAHAEMVNWVQCRRLDHMEIVQHYQKKSGNKSTKVMPMQPGMAAVPVRAVRASASIAPMI